MIVLNIQNKQRRYIFVMDLLRLPSVAVAGLIHSFHASVSVLE